METEEKKLTVFDFYRNIIKKEPLVSKDDVQKYFDIIEINKIFSHDKVNILLAQEVNYLGLEKWPIYLYYYYAVAKRNFVPFLNLKKEKNEDKEKLMEIAKIIFPEYSKTKLEDVTILLKEELSQIKIEDLKYRGGIEKTKKEKKHDST